MTDLNRDINITLNTGTILRFFLIGILILAIYYMFDVVLVIATAIVIASAIEPIIRRMKRMGVHRIVSVIIIYLIGAVILAALAVFFLPLVIKDAVEFLTNLPQTVSLEEIWGPIRDAGLNLGTGSGAILGEHTVSVSEFINGLQSLIVDTSAGAFKTASIVFGGVLSFILMVVLSFYLAVKEDGVDDFLRIVAPVRHHDYIIDLWKRSQRKIALWLQGQIILGLVVGLLVYVVLKIVGIPHALILAVFAGFFEIIPIFGPIISAIPAVLIGFVDHGIGTGALLIVLYLAIHQLENQVLYPLVVKKVVGISPIIVILGLVIGAKLAGLLGAIIVVPLLAAFMEYIHDIEKYKKAEVAERAAIGKGFEFK